MLTNKSEVYDEGLVLNVSFEGDLTHAYVYDVDRGVYAAGHARLAEGDKYSQKIGERIASSRAWQRYYKKVEKKIIRSLDEPLQTSSAI